MGSLLSKGTNKMRLFFRYDGNTTSWHELDIAKISPMKGDHIFCHTEDDYHYINGMLLIDNAPQFTVHKPAPTTTVTKPISGLAFFTKIPQDISIERNVDSVVLTVVI
jgi:hypothetical protein